MLTCLKATWSKAWRFKSWVSKASRFTRGKPDSARPTSRPSCLTMLAARARRSVAKEAWRAALPLYWKSQIEGRFVHREGKAGRFTYEEGKVGRFTYEPS